MILNENWPVCFFCFSVCPPGKYKYGVGDDKCQTCPAHSKAPEQGMSECRCNTGYFRSTKDPKSAPCTRKYSFTQRMNEKIRTSVVCLLGKRIGGTRGDELPTPSRKPSVSNLVLSLLMISSVIFFLFCFQVKRETKLSHPRRIYWDKIPRQYTHQQWDARFFRLPWSIKVFDGTDLKF